MRGNWDIFRSRKSHVVGIRWWSGRAMCAGGKAIGSQNLSEAKPNSIIPYGVQESVLTIVKTCCS